LRIAELLQALLHLVGGRRCGSRLTPRGEREREKAAESERKRFMRTRLRMLALVRNAT